MQPLSPRHKRLCAQLQYVRPPSLKLNSINLGNYGVSSDATAFTVTISLGISVANPNWFNVDFSEINADVTYPGTSAQFGEGTLYNVNFAGHTSSTFDFPLDLKYSTSIDPNRIILTDLISEWFFRRLCGHVNWQSKVDLKADVEKDNCGTSRSQVTVDYALHLKLKILSFVIPFTVNSAASFECPISAADITVSCSSGAYGGEIGNNPVRNRLEA